MSLSAATNAELVKLSAMAQAEIKTIEVQADQAAAAVKKEVSAHPWVAVVIAFVVGFLAGMAVCHFA